MGPVTKNLIIINFIVWLAQWVLQSRGIIDLDAVAGLHYFTAPDFQPWQLISYMFLHGGFTHLFFNMFTLWMFGSIIESSLGSARFLFYYISCGICAALVQEAVWAMTWQHAFIVNVANASHLDFETVTAALQAGQIDHLVGQFQNMLLTVGASGAIYGILLAFGMLFPNRPIYMMFIPIPVKAKYMVIAWGVIELLVGVSSSLGAADGVAHWAHLGGMIFGFFMIWYWKRKGVVHGDSF